MFTTEEQNQMHQDIDTIFRSIFPECGMSEREEQIKLSHNMLSAMTGEQIALSGRGHRHRKNLRIPRCGRRRVP